MQSTGVLKACAEVETVRVDVGILTSDWTAWLNDVSPTEDKNKRQN